MQSDRYVLDLNVMPASVLDTSSFFSFLVRFLNYGTNTGANIVPFLFFSRSIIDLWYQHGPTHNVPGL
jgi:hypothetical protein